MRKAFTCSDDVRRSKILRHHKLKCHKTVFHSLLVPVFLEHSLTSLSTDFNILFNSSPGVCSLHFSHVTYSTQYHVWFSLVTITHDVRKTSSVHVVHFKKYVPSCNDSPFSCWYSGLVLSSFYILYLNGVGSTMTYNGEKVLEFGGKF